MTSAEGSAWVFEFECLWRFPMSLAEMKSVFVLVTEGRAIGGDQFRNHASSNYGQENEKGGHNALRSAAWIPHRISADLKGCDFGSCLKLADTAKT